MIHNPNALQNRTAGKLIKEVKCTIHSSNFRYSISLLLENMSGEKHV